MEHKGTALLESERLLLRPFAMNDAAAMFRNWANDAEVTRYLTWPVHTDPSVTETVVQKWVLQNADPAFYQWAIVPKRISEPIGSISVVRPIDERIRDAEIGYCIGKNWWHNGITSEAAALVIRFLFEQVGVSRITAKHDVNNPHSGLVMQKCGMHYEGTLRQAGWNNQGVCDLAVYGLLRGERTLP